VTLTLELIESAGVVPANTRHVFGEEGGTIGRAPSNAWVIPHSKVSGLHARISFRNGVFYIEDTSRNGVCVNSPENRLVRNRPYAMKSGDRLFIEPYEIRVWIADDGVAADAGSNDFFSTDDPFLPPPEFPGARSSRRVSPEPVGDEVDPLKFFDPVGGPPPRKRAELPVDDGLGQHYQPPSALPDPMMPPAPPVSPAAPASPAGYNPLADEPVPEPIAPPARPAVRPRPGDSAVIRRKRDSSSVPVRPRGTPQAPAEALGDPFAPAAPPAARDEVAVPAPPPVPLSEPQSGERVSEADPIAPAMPFPPSTPPAFEQVTPVVPPDQVAGGEAGGPAATAPPPRHVPPPAVSPASPAQAAPPQHAPSAAVGGSDLAALLAGAGVPDAVVTSELTRSLGEILKIVVVGLMDVLQSRQRIKEEFRMQQTIFRPSENNPLKFSVNVQDALHNLLVKRNPAYLGPVEAFADAFDDLRDHQLAMLAGMRVAFEAMLKEFDPERLQQEFDSQLGRSSLALVPAKLRYWDLYKARRAELLKDPEDAFDHLFGDEFRRAYEEQFRKLKAQRRAHQNGSTPPNAGGE
jgi:type VI secretion system FHA domain protein